MRYAILILLTLLVIGCRHKIVEQEETSDVIPGQSVQGLIPMRVGNWWEYRVRSYNPDSVYTVRREIRDFGVLGTHEYYTFVDSLYPTGELDTLYYLRNVRDLGVVGLSHPPDAAFTEDTLFWWPQVHAGYNYWYGQDSVVVLYDYPGFNSTADTLGPIMSYQRFVGGSSSTTRTYSLLADTIGLLSEEGNAFDGRSYDLTAYHVLH
jgi:hypothetical protein